MAKDIEFALKRLESIVGTRMALAGTITALSRMTASRDPYTAGHQLRVGSLGARIATKLNLDPSMILLIQQSGELHDVGKIAIPTEILSRPGRFSTLEYDMVKRHTLIGGDILSRALLPWPIAEVAMQHHERLDGSGYPYGLQGDQIGRPARIIAVADVVEAMTQHRPYRPALGLDAALGEVSQGAGTKYDADVVSACLEVFADGYEFESDLGSLWD
jgi:HD-GYP domain-containing protein (c-di-GMP phosphodiesterase class II)